ncbi:hypothetical protein F2Q69_00055638 [Brassica cretica]|uniref:Uncharacterized protein n=1 Tax=Brassica cretica TaxID=69181 RepID=A0A8S9N3T7_BRACR|nr:hypothetical protein F2Q69_00055638 [Brassica cretica]
MDHPLLPKTEMVQMVMPNWAMDGPFDSSIAEPSIFISEKPKGKSENNFEDLKDFSDSLPIFDKYDEELMESWITCEDECDLPSPKPDLMFDIDNEETNGLTCFEPEHPSSLVLVSQTSLIQSLMRKHQAHHPSS